MPNREGGYGGYKQDPRRSSGRRVNSPGTGGVHRVGQDPLREEPRRDSYYRAPYAPSRGGDDVRSARYDPDGLEEDWVRAEEYVPPRTQDPSPRSNPSPRPPRRRVDPARQQAARQRRRAQRRLLLLGTIAGILVVSGVVTLVLPESAKTPPSQISSPETALADRLVAPLPYGGGDGSSTTNAQAVDWGTVGPVKQSETYTYTALPTESGAVPEFGRVTTDWFSDAAFLGDSLTVGYVDYDIDLSGARILAYEGASPNNFVNRTTMKNANDEEEIPFDLLAADPPAKLYVLVGTNAIASGTADDSFLNYYGRMLDDLKTILPDTMIFVQSILPVRPEVLESSPGMATDHLNTINSAIRDMCTEKGCYYLDLAAAFTDSDGNLIEDYAQPDGIHLTVSGYNNWVTYLCTHVPYNKDNPYQAGSTYYLDDSIKQLLTDLP